MTNIGPISESSIQSWLSTLSQSDLNQIAQQAGITLPPIQDTTSSSSLTDDSTLMQELLAMMPNPAVTPAIISQIFANSQQNLGIVGSVSQTGSQGGGQPTTDQINELVESSIVLAAVLSWVNAQAAIAKTAADAATSAATSGSGTTSPVTTTMQNYVQSCQPYTAVGTNDPIQALQFIRGNPMLTSSLNTVDPTLLAQAFTIAEQQIALECLQRSIQVSQQAHDQQKQDQIRQDQLRQSNTSSASLLFQAYVDEIKRGESTLSQQNMAVVMFVIASGSMIASGSTIAITGAQAAGQTSASLNPWTAASSLVPMEIRDPLTVLSNAYMQMPVYWSIPTAVSLLAEEGGGASEAATTSAAVKAYALAMMQMVQNPDFDTLLKSVVLNSVNDPNSVTTEQLKQWTAALKVTLLMNVLAAMERMDVGNLTATELSALLQGSIALKDGDIRKTLVGYIQEQLSYLPSDDQESLLNSLFAFYDKNPPVETLIDPSKSFLALCNTDLSLQTQAAESV